MMNPFSTSFRMYWGAISFSILVAGCTLACKSPFSTREPEPPERQQRTNWVQPTNASDVLINLKNALQDRNLTNYLRCFGTLAATGSSFRFFPSQRAQIRFPGIWDNWNLEQEQAYITNVFHAVGKDSTISLIFIGEGVENPFPDSTIFVKEYELHVGHNRNPEQFPKVVKGRAEFGLGLNSEGYWIIFYWKDDNLEQEASWSELKAAFIQ